MSAKTYHHGHPIYFDAASGAWRYEDGTPLLEETRPCPRCGEMPVDRQDPCIAGLPGVKFACCGHGAQEGYIVFTDGTVVRGRFTVKRGVA